MQIQSTECSNGSNVTLFVSSESAASERRFDKAMSVASLKERLEPITGVPASTSKLFLCSGDGNTRICALDDDSKALGFYPVEDALHIQVVGEKDSAFVHPDAKRARFLTLNIFLRPPGIKNNSSDHKNARNEMFGKHFLKNFDIVALQEMFSYGSCRSSQMVQYGRKHGFEFSVSSPAKSVFNGQIDGGLIILSKYPIVRTEKITYRRGVHADRFSAKGAIYAKIALSSNFFVHVFTTHLQSSPDLTSNVSDPSVVTRLGQIAALKEFIDDCTKNKAENEPIVLLGDINTNGRDNSGVLGASSEEYKMIYQILNGNAAKFVSPCADAGGAPPVTRRASVPGLERRYSVRDLAYEKYGEHPITYADVYPGTKIPRETVLTLSEDLGECCSLDYIFLMNSAGAPEPGSAPLNYKIENTQVERFIVLEEPFTQLSDHYGISTELVFKHF